MRVAEPTAGPPVVVSLNDPRAADRATVGPKSANLARAAAAGLPVLDGFVLAPETAVAVARARVGRAPTSPADMHAATAALDAWEALSSCGRHAVVVRSSATDEDGVESSNAGRFTSVLDVRNAEAFLDAVAEVVDSAASLHTSGEPRMAVLVQRAVDPATGGVAFGYDPVTGRVDRAVVVAVDGHPAGLVGGEVQGERVVLTRTGKVVERSGETNGRPLLNAAQRRQVLRLGRKAADRFGAAQDIEWAFDGSGQLWLLQSRPITAAGKIGTGPVFGPGPVAETFPERLLPLEEDLWLEPLRVALTEAIGLVGAAPRQRLRTSPVVISVGGWVAADLDLVNGRAVKARGLRRLDPRPSLRRLASAWRVGRLRAALPALVDDLVLQVDDDLRRTPDLTLVNDEKLLVLLDRSHQVLVALHGHEVLAGALDAPGGETVSAQSLALGAVVAGRRAGLGDADLIAAQPVVLSLSAPSIKGAAAIGPVPDRGEPIPNGGLHLLGPREALRLRARWVQELTAAVVRELARRADAMGRRADLDDLALLDLAELTSWYTSGTLPSDLPLRRRRPAAPPLPAMFRLADDGSVVAQHDGGRAGEPAGGGRAIGVVHAASEPPPDGAVLVVQTLDPRLAPWLPSLSGLVAETGSPLSHLAILAREYGVATVVGVTGARERFPAGSTVVVDGGVGSVELLPDSEAAGL